MKENKKIMMILGLFLLLNKFAYSESEVTSIEFKVKPGGGSQIRVLSDKNLQYQNQYQEDQKQVIIDIDDAKLGKMASRILDTSSFRSPVLMVSPYQLKDQNKKVRIVAQLRTNALAKVSQEQNVLLVDFDESFEIDDEFSFLDEPPLDQEAKDSTAESASSEQKDEFLDFNAPIDSAVGAVSSSGSVSSGSVSLNQPVVGTISPPTSSVTSTNIEAFEASQRTQNFQGRSITLKVHDSDVRDVLRLIGEASGFNIVIGDGVQGKITLSLEDVPWDQALNVVLNSMKLGAERNNNILRVMPLDALTQERISNIKAKAAAERSAPRVTRVFPISYAELASLKTVLEKFGSSKIAGDTSNDFIPATVELDERTNSLIVQDISDNIDRMARLIELLDTQTHLETLVCMASV